MAEKQTEENDGNSFWDKLGVVFGAGSALIALYVDDNDSSGSKGKTPPFLHENQQITGVVAVEGGNADQQGEIRVAVEERWITYIYTGNVMVPVTNTKRYSETILSPILFVAAHSDTTRLPFTATVPEGVALEHEWFVVAAFAAGGTLSAPRTEFAFKLMPSLAVQGIVNALVAASGIADCKITGGAKGKYQCRLKPSDREKLDLLSLDVIVSRATNQISGQLIINPQEHTLKEHLQALVGANNERHPFAFSASALDAGASASHEPSEEVVRYFRECLTPYLSCG